MTISRAAPLHPIFVHFTIALVGSSLAFDVLSRMRDSTSLAAAGWWTIAASVPLSAGTIITGLISRSHVDVAEGRSLRFLRLHEVLGPAFFGGLVAMGVWRAGIWQGGGLAGTPYLMVLLLLVLLMAFQGYLGGELVYAFGMQVKDDRHERLSLHDSAEPPR